MPTLNEATNLWEADIDGHRYEFKQWGAKQALSIGIDLTHVASTGVTGLGDALKNVTRETMSEAQLLAGALGAIFRGVGEHHEQALRVVEALAAKDVLRDGVPIANIATPGNPKGFDGAYAGRLGHLRKVVTAALEVQYADFFAELRAAFSSIQGMLRNQKAAGAPTPTA